MDSVYHIDHQKIEPELFFETINAILKKIKQTKGKIYFLGNGASAAYANYMALDLSKNGKILSKSHSDSAIYTSIIKKLHLLITRWLNF